ncbi:hypothetical protein PG993_010027 [Apiospora rasikravindrae]|uniref:Uncharacterized protein n=1 Tax=Apiospora rasikravindrae TaxID=990691 RepID=A0ABR1SLC9_9PEZI
MIAAGTALMSRFSLGSLFLTCFLVISIIAAPVHTQPSWTTGNWATPGDRSGGARWWSGSGGSYEITQNQGQGDPGQGQGPGQGRYQESPSPPPGAVVSKGTPRIGLAFKIDHWRPAGARCSIDLYCNGCNWNGAYCTEAMVVIASDPACERACACMAADCSSN